MKPVEVNIIEILWDGPYNINEVCSMDKPEDKGLYQIYGAHDIHGSNVLLYLDKTVEQTFGARFTKHKYEWIQWEPTRLDIYVSRLQDDTEFKNDVDLSVLIPLINVTNGIKWYHPE